MARYINVDELRMKIRDKYTISYFKPTKEDMQLIGIFEIINAQPTADVEEVKHGEWYLRPDGCGTCSNCRRTQKSVWDLDNTQFYCGHCGAKMDGEDVLAKQKNDFRE